MKTLPFRWPIVALLALVVSAGALHVNSQLSAAEEVCGEFGTSVHFVESPAEAAKQALKAEKLVFVLHVSGYFEEPDFT
jgi:hypothetical protein